MRVLITGISGMIGSHLARRLVGDGAQVLGLVRGNATPLRLADIARAVTLLPADLRDRSAVALAVAQAQADIVVHLASTPFNPPPTSEDQLSVNVLGTDNLMAALALKPVKRVLFTGSGAQYGSGDGFAESDPERPTTLLGASKTAAAALIHTYGRMAGMATVELRLFTPYGPWERPGRLVPHVILSALNGRPVELSRGDQERDYLHIDDVVEAMIRAMHRPLPPACVLNVCSGEGIAVATLAAQILTLMGNPVLLRLGVLPTRPDEIMKFSGSWEMAGRLLGWSPTVLLADGLRQTIDWVSTNRDLATHLT